MSMYRFNIFHEFKNSNHITSILTYLFPKLRFYVKPLIVKTAKTFYIRSKFLSNFLLYLVSYKSKQKLISSKFIKCSNNYNGLEISAMNKKLYFSNSHSKMLLEVTFNYKLKFDCPKNTDLLFGIRKKSTYKWKYFYFSL